MNKIKKIDQLILTSIKSSSNLQDCICQQMKDLILKGHLTPGLRLPSTRNFAIENRIARGTVVAAFEQLLAEGYIDSKRGSGFFVAQQLPDSFFTSSILPDKKEHPVSLSGSKFSQKLNDSNVFSLLRNQKVSGIFRSNQPDLSQFPIDVWHRLASKTLKKMSLNQLANQDAAGFFPLRRSISKFILSTRGIDCSPEQIIIVSGIQQALDLTARMVLNSGDQVIMEDPGYIGAKAAFESLNAKIINIPTDQFGLCLDDVFQKASKPRLIYCTPTHQFPLGSTLSLERRLSLLTWAQQNKIWIFEDDYDSEFRFKTKPLGALKSLDQRDIVIHAGTFNKMLFPALRLGYMIVPSEWIQLFLKARSQIDRYNPILEQIILNQFIEEGHFGRHIRKMRKLYHSRYQFLMKLSIGPIQKWLDIQETSGGLQTIAWLKQDLSEHAICKEAQEKGLEILPLSKFLIGRKIKNGLLLGFGSSTEKELKEGIHILADILEKQSRKK